MGTLTGSQYENWRTKVMYFEQVSSLTPWMRRVWRLIYQEIETPRCWTSPLPVIITLHEFQDHSHIFTQKMCAAGDNQLLRKHHFVTGLELIVMLTFCRLAELSHSTGTVRFTSDKNTSASIALRQCHLNNKQL